MDAGFSNPDAKSYWTSSSITITVPCPLPAKPRIVRRTDIGSLRSWMHSSATTSSFARKSTPSSVTALSTQCARIRPQKPSRVISCSALFKTARPNQTHSRGMRQSAWPAQWSRAGTPRRCRQCGRPWSLAEEPSRISGPIMSSIIPGRAWRKSGWFMAAWESLASYSL
jgi:hypothetical protein